MSLGLIPQDVIDRIRERAEIAEVVSGYVTLIRAGQHLKGLCPFHAEKTPSFTVSPSRQMFHCFGCGVGGNVFTFIMKIEGTAFPDAVRELGRRTGIPVPTVTGGSSGPQAALRERLERLNDAAGAYFHRTLVDSDAGRVAREYLAHRGITPATIEAFRIGWAPPAWDGLLRALAPEGFTVEELERAGLVVPKDPNARRAATASSHYDRFRARVMFPIGDLSRRTIGFGGRVLDDAVPKYLNSPETPLFSKGRALFALDRAREPAGRANTVLIVEGYFDAIALHQAGIANAVATLGTALTPDHIRAMRRFASQVVLLFDPDAAGVRAAIRTLDLFADSGMSVRVVSLPDGADPDTFVRTGGPDSFARLVEQATTLLDFAVEHSLQSAASGGIEDRIRSVDDILRILHKTSHRIEKEECLRRVAERLGINQQRLVERYPELAPKGSRPLTRQPDGTQAGSLGVRRVLGSPEERDLVHLLLQGKLTADHVRALSADAFTVPGYRRIVEIALRHQDSAGRIQLRPVLDDGMADADCGSIVTELAMAERVDDDLERHVRGCLDRLARKNQERMLEALIARLRVAERDGRADEARVLNTQINELRVKKAGAAALQ